MIVFGNCDSTTTSSPSLVTPSEPPSLKMGDLEDLNRTLYDIGAQDLLDVWDAMETEVSFYQKSFPELLHECNGIFCLYSCRDIKKFEIKFFKEMIECKNEKIIELKSFLIIPTARKQIFCK